MKAISTPFSYNVLKYKKREGKMGKKNRKFVNTKKMGYILNDLPKLHHPFQSLCVLDSFIA